MSMSAAIFGAIMGCAAASAQAFVPPVDWQVVVQGYANSVLVEKGYGSADWKLEGAIFHNNQITHFGKTTMQIGSVTARATGSLTDMSRSTVFNFGSADFTVEAWINPFLYNGEGTPADRVIMGRWSDGSTIRRIWQLSTYQTNRLKFSYRTSASSTVVNVLTPAVSGLNLFDGNFHHVVVQRSGATLYYYIDGSVVHTSAAPTLYSSTSNSFASVGSQVDVYPMSLNAIRFGEVRVTTDVARYATSGFSVPTALFPRNGDDPYWFGVVLITDWQDSAGKPSGLSVYSDFQSGTEIDFTGESGFAATTSRDAWYHAGGMWDGAGYSANTASIRFSNATDGRFDFGTEDFTVEFWLTRNGSLSSLTRYLGPFYITHPSSTTLSIYIPFNSELKVFTDLNAGSSAVTHFALVRDGLTLRMYREGVQVGEMAVAADDFVTFNGAGTTVFELVPSTSNLLGIKGFRMCKPVCLYPGGTSFTVPDAEVALVI